MLQIPAVVQRLLFPILLVVGRVFGEIPGVTRMRRPLHARILEFSISDL